MRITVERRDGKGQDKVDTQAVLVDTLVRNVSREDIEDEGPIPIVYRRTKVHLT